MSVSISDSLGSWHCLKWFGC